MATSPKSAKSTGANASVTSTGATSATSRTATASATSATATTTAAEPTRPARSQGRSRRVSGVLANLGTYAVLLIAAVLTLSPFLVSALTAFTSPRQFAQRGPLRLPDPPTLENFAALFTGTDGFVTPVVVTVQMVAVILVGQMVFSILAAYAFARLRFPGRDLLFWVYVATLMVPQAVVVVPLYLMMSEAGLRNTFWALVVPFMLGSPYAIFLLRESFRTMPSELIDAMRVDGAGHLRLLWNLVLPLNRPTIVTLVLITVVTHWNSFLWPLVITTGPEWRTVTVATASLQSQYNNNWTLVMAATTLAMVPLVLLFIVFQRQITRSIGASTLR